MSKSLSDLLSAYDAAAYTPFHMPGHKRRSFAYLDAIGGKMDITEIPGFDNLHDPQGILRESAELAASVFSAQKAFFLVGGSTCGILSALYACCGRGDRVVAARNCHISVYNAAELFALDVDYVYPPFDESYAVYASVTPESVSAALQSAPDAAAVIVTSPTYDGVTSDLAGVCAAAHAQHVPVIVDAAHGAHFGFDDYFPASAVSSGADIVITSLHKTLPSLTSTALAFVNNQKYEKKFARALSIFETSSPSYLLLASIDGCVRLMGEQGSALCGAWAQRLDAFRRKCAALQNITVPDVGDLKNAYGYDRGKLLLCAKGCAGGTLYDLLRREKIEPEMYGARHALAMTSLADPEAAYTRLFDALTRIDRLVPACRTAPDCPTPPEGRRACAAADAAQRDYALWELQAARGKICAEYVFAYPPGVPVLTPGEIVTADVLDYLQRAGRCGVAFRHSLSESADHIAALA